MVMKEVKLVNLNKQPISLHGREEIFEYEYTYHRSDIGI